MFNFQLPSALILERVIIANKYTLVTTFSAKPSGNNLRSLYIS